MSSIAMACFIAGSSATPNGNVHKHEDYLRRRGAVSFQRVSDGAAASCGGSPTQEQVEGEKRFRLVERNRGGPD